MILVNPLVANEMEVTFSISSTGQTVFVPVRALRRSDVVVDVRRRSALPEVQVRREGGEGCRPQDARRKMEVQSGTICA